ncbi:DUF1810 family protein [Brevundimonas sp. SPF441]|uniref:DUF1810 family protein n=1 Tax=Brevundimonas sp. SPF441 TaxID=2663795 RepID=UPI00351A11A1
MHPILGNRLRRAARAATTAPGTLLHEVFGSPDDLKFVSSMTLFAAVAEDSALFEVVLASWRLMPDPLKLRLVACARTGAARL